MSWNAGPLYPCNPATARSESTKLSVDPLGEKLAYTNGRVVIIRDLMNPAIAHAYTQHTQTATVARFSPSGFYCASGDVAGNVRIWDIVNSENVIKLAIRPLSGKINDLAWDGESKRIIVGGEGKDKFGAAFFMDSGSSCGEISGHAKPITAVSIRHQRPFRAVSGSDDNSIVLHTAVPFKYDKIISTHNRFVRDVGYSPNGDVFASVASDGKLFLYDGKTGEVQSAVEGNKSQRSLMALSWSLDSQKVATAGADGVVSIWDAATSKLAQSYVVGPDTASQQNGIVYANSNTVVSVSLSGMLNVFDLREGPSSKWRIIDGPVKSITASVLNSTSETERTFYTGSFDGSIKSFAIGSGYGSKEGECTAVSGIGHNARIVGISSNGKGKVHSAGWDDKVSAIQGVTFVSSSLPTRSQPTGVAATPAAVYVGLSNGLEIVTTEGPTANHPVSVSAIAAISAPGGGDLIAYGSNAKKVTLATMAGTQVNVEAEFEDNKGEVVCVEFSPDGSLLAAGDVSGRVVLIDVKEKKTLVSSRWTFHNGRITSLSFSPSGKRLASGGADESIYIWEIDKVLKNTAIKNAHPGGVSGVAWAEGNAKVISAGADACVRIWEVAEI